jgi:hypothetical protein
LLRNVVNFAEGDLRECASWMSTATINEVALYCNSTADSQVFARAVLGNISVSKGASDNINISYDVIMTTR